MVSQDSRCVLIWVEIMSTIEKKGITPTTLMNFIKENCSSLYRRFTIKIIRKQRFTKYFSHEIMFQLQISL